MYRSDIQRDSRNYRGILNIPGKIYRRVWISIVMESMKERVAGEQGVFRSGRCIGHGPG